jgi:CheY-like chemotaxis protein
VTESGQRSRGARILIIEDEPIIAANIQELLEEHGFIVVGLARKLEAALALVQACECDAAIVDANLAGTSAGPAALALVARRLPFIVLSGYSREQLSGDFSGGFFVQKPYRPFELIDFLQRRLG